MEYLRVANWEKYQNYRKDRGQPPWIKVHRKLLRNGKWLSLTDAERGQLVCLWMLAADHDGEIHMDRAMIERVCFMSGKLKLEKFIEIGFLTSPMPQDDATYDANLTSPMPQNVCPKAEAKAETEAETEADKSAAGAALVIPDWLPQKTWKEFKSHRQKLKAPMTPKAEDLLIKKLDRLRQEGNNPVAVIERSIECGWKGVFPLKPEHTSRDSPNKPNVPEFKYKDEGFTSEQMIENQERLGKLLTGMKSL